MLTRRASSAAAPGRATLSRCVGPAGPSSSPRAVTCKAFHGVRKRLTEIFGDDQPGHFGTGWWSGILSAFFGLLSLGLVIVLHWPQLLSSASLRGYYPMHVMRMAIQIAIGFAIADGLVSAVLRAKKILGLTGMLLALVATMLGGSSVEINEPLTSGPSTGRSTAWGAKTPWVRVRWRRAGGT